MVEPTKADYEKARETWAARVINIGCELEAAKAGFDYCSNKIDEFPEEEEDEVPEEVKEIVEAVK